MARPGKTSIVPASARTRVRCAIYTRKSTEDGLEQAFNSLDAQREACAAYVLSQRHEGWTLLPDVYDDGGFSGGNTERPGLKQLLADVEAGRVDVIVVYKVDRLTRSLADFAKIVEVLDAKGASFVSVTQAFNTTTSMGRLTLNVLLSFAQFEREVTGERIRDKIAASKKNGLWMGGPVPLGYDLRDRKLIINLGEAEQVRHIFRRYAALPSLRALAEELARDGYRTKRRVYRDGRIVGDIPFTAGPLAYLLQNRIYRGEVVHKGTPYPGEHEAIIDEPLWDIVQAKLKTRGPGLFAGERRTGESPLIGLLHDGAGRRMTSTHATRGSRRYRYYVTRKPSGDEPAWRIGARDIELIIEDRIKALLLDADRVRRIAIGIDLRRAEAAARAAAQLSATSLLPRLAQLGLQRIDLHEDRVDMVIGERALLRACGLSVAYEHDAVIAITAPVIRVRRGSELKLVVPGPGTMSSRTPDPQLVALVAESFALRETMLTTGKPVSVIATEAGKCRKRMMRLLPLAWLAPDIVEAIVQGSQPATLTHQKLLSTALPIRWKDQRTVLGFANT